MAQETGRKSSTRLLTHLSFELEARTEPIIAPTTGRFKFFKEIFRKYTTQLFVMNLMTAITALPILLMVGLVMYLGMENFGYAASGLARDQVPYFLTNIGMGLSSGASVSAGSVYLYQGYRVLFIGVGIFAPLMGIGYSGLSHVVNKMMWQEPFQIKYGKIGNPISLVYREYFKGIKENWWENIICMAVAGGTFVAVSTAYLNLLERLAVGNATAWSWVAVIASTIFALIVALTLMTLIPSIPQYHGKLNFLQKAKNSLILDLGVIMPLIMMCVLIFGLVALCSINSFFQIIGIVLAFALGFAFISLTQTNFMHYAAANIITPGYEVVSKNKSFKKSNAAQKQNKANVKITTVKAEEKSKKEKPSQNVKPTQPQHITYKKKK